MQSEQFNLFAGKSQYSDAGISELTGWLYDSQTCPTYLVILY